MTERKCFFCRSRQWRDVISLFYLVVMLFILDNLPACRGQINEQVFKSIATPGYKPSSLSTTPDDLSAEAEIINKGVHQVANTLPNSPPMVTTTTTTDLKDEVTMENFIDQPIDYNDKNLCGVRPLVKAGRIVGGKNARFGEWPWQVFVRETYLLTGITVDTCGGVIVSSSFVATAASCQPGIVSTFVVVFGENVISDDEHPRYPVTRDVRRVIVHEKFNVTSFENDLALLELKTPIKFDAHIVPICLPPDDADFTGRMATVTGWGRLKYEGEDWPSVLQEVQVPVLENSACKKLYQTVGHAILDSYICAGYAYQQKGVSKGDGGGPLVLQGEDGRWQLVGIVSHCFNCSAISLPGVYMRATYYKPWLKSIIDAEEKREDSH